MKKIKSAFKWLKSLSLLKKVVLIVVLGTLLFFIARSLLSKSSQQTVTTDTVKRATIVDTVSESGNIQSNQLTVYSVSSGVIEELYVKNGDTVKKGDKLFKVKSTASNQDKASAYATYLSAKNTLANAEAKINSLQAAEFKANQTFMNGKGGEDNPDTSDPNYIQEKANWLQAEADYKNQATAISQAQASLNSASLSYQATQDSIVTAQVGGTIANVSYSVGDQVTASMNSSSNTDTTASSVLVIGTDTENVVKIQINELNVNKIQVGQEATVTVSAIKDQTFRGEVERVDDYGTNTSGVITYNVFVKITDDSPLIKPLMSSIVTIQTAKHENAFVVPNTAIKLYQAGKAVQVKDTGTSTQLKYIPVKTGIKTATQTEILEGVTEGMEIVTSTTTSTTTKSSGGLFGGPPGN